jgi:hypothetical protein
MANLVNLQEFDRLYGEFSKQWDAVVRKYQTIQSALWQLRHSKISSVAGLGSSAFDAQFLDEIWLIVMEQHNAINRLAGALGSLVNNNRDGRG